jgi:acetyl coenzyme A synthetase (ADP forming)-like protein
VTAAPGARPAAPLDALFAPRSIAVVGASRDKRSIGSTILWNLIAHGFTGKVFPVNPRADAIHSIKCHPSVGAIEDDVDLAIVVVPAAAVLGVARECAEKGVRALCVITAGFRETGPEGARAERELVAICRGSGMRLLGPNGMGVLNTDPAVSMDGTFAPSFPRPGPVAFLSQSGAMGVSILDHALDLGVGISMFASTGNKADVSGNDLLEHWRDHPAVGVVLMYLESFGNPRRFVPIARDFTRRKPIVCVKAGRTAEGARAAASHTGSLAGADVAVDALLEQTGVLRVESVSELFDVAQALSTQPLPAGRRVAILTNGGGPGILATDFVVGRGLEVAKLSEETRRALRAVLVPEASVGNPVDMVAGAGREEYAAALPILLADPGVDLVVTIFVPPVTQDPVAVARAIFEASRGAEKPVLGCFMARDAVLDEIKRLESAWFPLYVYPEDAVRAAYDLVRVRELRDDDLGRPVRFEVDRDRVEAILARALDAGGGWLPAEDAFAVLEAYGVPHARTRSATDAAEAVAAAREIGGPVAVKLDGEAFLHKSDVGGVVLDVRGDEAVRAAVARLSEAARRAAPGAPRRFAVQRMVPRGTELVAGARVDPVFGPILLVGLGGVYVEVLRDVQSALVPLTPVLARRMLSRLRAYPILLGARGGEPADVDAVVDVLLRLSQLCEDHPAVAECEMNPVVARPDGVTAADVRLRVEHPARGRPGGDADGDAGVGTFSDRGAALLR